MDWWIVWSCSGAALCFLLLSCHRVPHDLAVKIMDLALPFYFGDVKISPPGVNASTLTRPFGSGAIPLVVIAISGINAHTAFWQWDHFQNEFKALQWAHIKSSEIGLEVERNMLTNERDFWRASLVCVIWVLAWRLKSLTQGDTPLLAVRGRSIDLNHAHIVPPHAPGARRQSVAERVKWSSKKIWQIVWAAASVVLADVPLARVSFLSRLESITAEKHRIEHGNYQCDGVLLISATGECQRFCEMVQEISRKRGEAMENAQRFHPIGNLASQMSDLFGYARTSTESLFKERSCTTVLTSVDKTDQVLNYLNWAFAIFGIMSFFMAVTKLFSDGRTKQYGANGAKSPAVPDPTPSKPTFWNPMVSGMGPVIGGSSKFDLDKFN